MEAPITDMEIGRCVEVERVCQESSMFISKRGAERAGGGETSLRIPHTRPFYAREDVDVEAPDEVVEELVEEFRTNNW